MKGIRAHVLPVINEPVPPPLPPSEPSKLELRK
jgi:hypothetical protein